MLDRVVTTSRRHEVAILGGGAAAMSAAFELTSLPRWQDRYHVTVYQLGWRLGGKCASGRGDDGRIEEHGLHVWFGAYANAFDMMQRCYAALNRRWQDAVDPQHVVVLKDAKNGDWMLPTEGASTPRWPKHGLDWTRGTPWTAVVKLTQWMDVTESDVTVGGTDRTLLRNATKLIGVLTLVDPSRRGLPLRTPLHTSIKDRLRTYHASIHRRLEGYRARDRTRQLLILLDLAAAIVRGILEDDVWIRGFDAVDDVDFRRWLLTHDATGDSVISAPIKAIYDLAFAYPRGQYGDDGSAGQLAAGIALRVIVGLVAYPDPPMWKTRWGMGDTVFAPLYEVLKKRGVTFKFFHRVKALHVSPDGTQVDRVDLDKQVRLKSGRDDDYEPLDRIKGVACWPKAPRWDQLADGERLRDAGAAFESAWYPDSGETVSLTRGDQFDSVVLGISVAALKEICSELGKVPSVARERWKQALSGLQTARTQAMQLWLRATLEELGYDGRPPVLGGLGEPLSTWADMTHLLEVEDWSADEMPRSIAYFCGVMADDPKQAPFTDQDYPATQSKVVRDQSLRFVDERLGAVWTRFGQRAGIAQTLAADPREQNGDARLDAQFWRANIDPTERYVLSLPGTTRLRLRPDDSGFKNLFLAGDWTWSELNCGAVEAAVISGRHAVSGLIGRHVPILGLYGDDPLVAWLQSLVELGGRLWSRLSKMDTRAGTT